MKTGTPDAEVALIREKLASEPAWMSLCFEVAIHQGCRLTETAVLQGDIDFDRMTILFRAKGSGYGGKHVFTTKLHPRLAKILKEKVPSFSSKDRPIFDLPEMASKDWWTFFRKVGLGHLCFHCTRVTVVTKMTRAGVPIAQAMAYVGHSSMLIHRIYQRLAAQDLSSAVNAI